MKVRYAPEVDVLSIVLSDVRFTKETRTNLASSWITTTTAMSSVLRFWTPLNAWAILCRSNMPSQDDEFSRHT